MFSFVPQTEQEILNLMPAGIYDFYVNQAELTTSKKSGKPMIKLDLRVLDANGTEKVVIDYLIDTMMYKVKHFCDSVGLEAEYLSGVFDADMCIGKNGKCKIIIDEPEIDSPFNAKNAIKDYVKRDKNAPKEPEKPFIDDEKLPF